VASAEGSLVAKIHELRAERERLTAELHAVTQQLANAAITLADIGVPESRVAREAGVSRQALRVWRGKDDYAKWRAGRGR
jgi:DUF1365 family protein